jgi:hypothetical protein
MKNEKNSEATEEKEITENWDLEADVHQDPPKSK